MYAWLATLTNAITRLTPQQTRLTLVAYPFEATLASALFEDEAEPFDRTQAGRALLRIASMWMAGEPLTEVAAAAVGERGRGNPGRGSGNPIPKVIAVVDQGLGFGLSRAAGALAAFAHVAADRERTSIWALNADEREELDLLPLAIRFGCKDIATTAWYRWGFRRRRVAHLVAAGFPPPPELRGDALASWIVAQRRVLLDEEEAIHGLGNEGRAAVVALRNVDGR